ncbi:PREDICTED: pectate lyase 12 isoform [Prunus dulcis]|uniref:PREDICTED: pectate lyase 12 isoform n=1 Tax=Prunus dulcis TaxID=3755 RepID=A0A5E4GEG4_PRUDU|nr:uncharacterized protein LOC117612619 [Prunus dulcis]VVA38010.1 PREDICTED: pectate lyase 12 isoform [Prunus dulcis]
MRGGPSISVWGGALQIQPHFSSLSHRFSSQMLRSCVAVPNALRPSSHRTGLAQRIFGFRKKREEDLRKKNWSNQYVNPQSAYQSGDFLCMNKGLPLPLLLLWDRASVYVLKLRTTQNVD